MYGPEGAEMPRVTAMNLRRGDLLREVEDAIRDALTSMPALEIQGDEVDLVPVLEPDDFRAAVARIDVDLWEHPERTKDALQELATRWPTPSDRWLEDRSVKAVIRPYDVGKSGWVSF